MDNLRRALLLSFSVAAVVSGCAWWRPSPAPGAEAHFISVETRSGDRPAVSPAQDTDRDGLDDLRERDLRSNPGRSDSDGDGFADGFEDLYAEFGFDLLRPSKDSDADGLEDAQEARLGTRADWPDTDGDGWGDFDEVLNKRYGFDPLSKTGDADFDGLADELEKRIGSSPSDPDSNGDGIEDFVAFAAGAAPQDKSMPGALGELMGTAESEAMRTALVAMRRGASFPKGLAEELPYAAVQRAIAAGTLKPSAALMRRSVYNPHHSPGLYPTYGEIVSRLFAIASQFDGTQGPRLVRMFQWSALTQECCAPREGNNKPGRRIYAVKISDNPDDNESEPEIAFLGAHHARELIGATFPLDLIERLTSGYATDPLVRKIVDTTEIWVIVVVNPNGYDHAAIAQDSWRKNTRRVSLTQAHYGVDVNRNYGWEHMSTLSAGDRLALPGNARDPNGLDVVTAAIDPESDQYPGPAAFTEVESQAVAGLAHNQFATEKRDEVDGLVCALSWHTFTGLALHPFSHKSTTSLLANDRAALGKLTDAYAVATGYLNVFDGFADLRKSNGGPFNGYPVWGDAADWLFNDSHVHAITIEAYSLAEGRIGDTFSPPDAAHKAAVSANNVNGALAFIRECQVLH